MPSWSGTGNDAPEHDCRTLQLRHHHPGDDDRPLHRHRERQPDQEADRAVGVPDLDLSPVHQPGKDHWRHAADPRPLLRGVFEPVAACADPDRHRGRRGNAGAGACAGGAHQRGVRLHRGSRNCPPGRTDMSGLMAQLPALQVVVPLLGALVAALINHRAFNYWLALAASWASLAIAAGLTLQVLDGGTISYAIGGWEPPWGIEYRVDELSAFVLMLVSAVGAAAMPFARRSVAQEIEEHRQGWFYSVYLLCLAGLLGIAITGDAFNSFVFLEISSLAMYTLIALGKDRRAPVAAYQYLIMGTIGATLYVAGIGFMYLATGTLNFADLSTRIEPAMADYSRTIVTALAFLTVGVSLKLALVPLHMWLPNAYAYAPSFVTVFIAATSTKVALYLLIRLFFSVVGLELAFSALPLTDVLVVLSVVAMFAASVVAVFQTDIKRMLAYSSLAQVGYITLGIALANHSGLTGSIVHLFNHALMKAALFMVLGAVFYRTASVQLDDLGGLWRKMPLTTAAFVVAGLGLIGTPGTA